MSKIVILRWIIFNIFAEKLKKKTKEINVHVSLKVTKSLYTIYKKLYNLKKICTVGGQLRKTEDQKYAFPRIYKTEQWI